MPKPNQLPKLQFPEMDPVFQQHYSQMIDTINTLCGYSGEVELAGHLNLGGNRITNVGKPVQASDAISNAVAASLYSAPALKSQLESTGSSPLVSYRQLNNQTQREQVSSFLNDLMSSVPNANGILPTLTNGVGTVTVSIPSTTLRFADGSSIVLNGRVDILTVPAQYAITTIAAVSDLVTVNCAATGLVAGQAATITGVSPSSFNGTFTLISSTGGGTTIEYQDPIGTVSGSGGFVQGNGTYYYGAQKRNSNIALFGPFSGDSAVNRLSVNNDGFQIVAVVVITNSGGQISLSGGGGSAIIGSPTAGAFF